MSHVNPIIVPILCTRVTSVQMRKYVPTVKLTFSLQCVCNFNKLYLLIISHHMAYVYIDSTTITRVFYVRHNESINTACFSIYHMKPR